jgi:hypothetical protein
MQACSLLLPTSDSAYSRKKGEPPVPYTFVHFPCGSPILNPDSRTANKTFRPTAMHPRLSAASGCDRNVKNLHHIHNDRKRDQIPVKHISSSVKSDSSLNFQIE